MLNKVIKRDGRSERFSKTKIKDAIKKASNSSGEEIEIKTITDYIIESIEHLYRNTPPTVEIIQDFVEKKWDNWSWPVLISPPNYDNKDACILPEKVGDKYLLFHRMGIDIDYAYVDSLDFDGHTWLEENIWVSKRPGMWDDWKVGISATPVKTDTCWILIYHGVSTEDHIYRVGAILMDLEDPTRIIGRSYNPLFEPEVSYELIGQVPNVVFPEGNIIRDGVFYVYYGGADSVVGVATMRVEDILKSVR